MSSIESRELYNFIQGCDISGESAYDIWKSFHPNGTEIEFLEYIRSGPQGEESCLYFLTCSDNIMKKDLNGDILPVSITFRSFYRRGTKEERNPYNGRFVIQETNDGIIWNNKYESKTDESSITYKPYDDNIKIIKCTLYAAGGTTQELDVQNVVILTEVTNHIDTSGMMDLNSDQVASGVKNFSNGIKIGNKAKLEFDESKSAVVLSFI